ncbi:MAG: DUF4136 domain-containing protein [Congregibacter sp.]
MSTCTPTRFWAILVSTLMLTACGTNPPVIDYDQGANFAAYKSYAFISDKPLMLGEGATGSSPLLEGRLMRATDTALRAKGFSKVSNPEAADFAVRFTVGARDKIRVNSYPEPYRPYYGGWGWGGSYYAGATSTDVQQYTEGKLAIDIYDVAEHKPVWHGVATARITDSMRQNPDETVTNAVTEILMSFPPGMLAK